MTGGALRLPGTTPRGPLLMPREAAAYLGVSLSTLKAWTRGGHVPCVRTPGGHKRYRATDLDEVLRIWAAKR